MNETKQLAEFVAESGYGDLSTQVVEATRVYILDNLASGLVGSSTPWSHMVGDMARENAPQGPCSVFARNWTTSPSYAALVNGTMIGGFETDHAFVQGSCHPSASVFPAAFAIAERDHLDGKSLLVSIALGYEVTCRVGLAATRAVEDVAGFHGPGTNACFGGAAGAAKAMGLDAPQTVNALGIAGSHAGGLMEFTREGAMTKRIHVGRGGQMGLESALLAARGFTGPSTVLEGDRGFLRVYSPSPLPELLVDGLGEHFILMDIIVKAYACHASFHHVIDAIRRFRDNHAFDATYIEHVKVAGSERMVNRQGDREPTTVLGAQYSLPFSMAVAICRDITDPLVYNEDTLWDERVRALAKSVEMTTDEERFGKPGAPTAEVTLTISGNSHVLPAAGWKGSSSNPCTYDDIASKFRRYASTYLPPATIEDIVEKVRDIEHIGDIADFARLLRGD